jgi:hypothetical protein
MVIRTEVHRALPHNIVVVDMIRQKRHTTLGLIAAFGIATAPVFGDNDAIMDVDNHAATFSGVWGTSTVKILYYGDNYQYAWGSGTSSATAEATFTTASTADISGQYEVYTRWTTHPNREETAWYRVYDGVADTGVNCSCYLNQTVNGGAWQYCCTTNLTAGNKGVVKLGNENTSTDEVVIADAVRFVRTSKDSDDIVNGSLTDVDIKDEAGIDWSGWGGHAAAGIAQCSSYSNLTSVTITAPTSGYVVVRANGITNQTVGGQTWRVCLDDASGGTTCDGHSWIMETSDTSYYENEKAWSLQKVYSVGAGSKTFYLKACHSEFSGGNVVWDDVVGTFYPTRY